MVRLVYTIVSCIYCKWDIFGDFQPLWTGKDISFSLNKLGTKVSISNIGCRASGRDSSRHPGRKPFFFVKTTRIYYLVDNAPNLNFHLRAEFSIVGLTRIIRGMSVKVKMEGWPQRPLRFKYILEAKLGFVTFVSHDVSMSKKWHELLWLGSHFTIVNGFAIKVQWSSPSRVKLPRFRKHYLTAKVFPKVPSKIQAIVTENLVSESKHFKY